jgi:NTE family protein
VTVDLIRGQAVVREQGDAVNSILESINLPVLSAPICRNGQALVDGGLLKNIPADVLVSQGCNFVIAVSVTAKMEQQVGENNPNTPTESMKPPGAIQAILRGLLVQSHNMNSIGVEPADVMIEPDVTGFELSDFVSAVDMAEIGEKAALEQIPTIKTLLTRMDSQLFHWD